MVFDTSAPVPEITLINTRWYSQMTAHLLIMKDLLGGEPVQSDEKRLVIRASKLEEYFQCFFAAFVL